MCTFQDERSVLVCDVARREVETALKREIGPNAQFTVIHGQGTLVELDQGQDPTRFRDVVQGAMAAANTTAPSDASQASHVELSP